MRRKIFSKAMLVVVAVIAGLGMLLTVLAAMINLAAVFGKGDYCEPVTAAALGELPDIRFGQVHTVMLCLYEPSATLVNTKYAVVLMPHAVMLLVCLVVFVAAIIWVRGRRATAFLAVAASVLSALALVVGLVARWLDWQAVARLVNEIGTPASLDAAEAAGAPWWVVPRTDYDPFATIDWNLIGLGVVLTVVAVALWRARAAERDVEGLV